MPGTAYFLESSVPSWDFQLQLIAEANRLHSLVANILKGFSAASVEMMGKPQAAISDSSVPKKFGRLCTMILTQSLLLIKLPRFI